MEHIAPATVQPTCVMQFFYQTSTGGRDVYNLDSLKGQVARVY